MLEQKIIVINTSPLIALVAAWGTRLSRCLDVQQQPHPEPDGLH